MLAALIIQQCVLLTCISLTRTQCRQEKEKYICNGYVPTQIPTDVTNMSIYGTGFCTILRHLRSFRNNTAWAHLKILLILPDTSENGTELLAVRQNLCGCSPESVKTQSFFFLKQLVYLRFQSPCLKSMESAVFLGLEQLETLDLNNNIKLTFDSAMNGLKGSKLMSLKNLYLQRLGTTYTLPTKDDIGQYFHFLKHFPIEFIDLSYVSNTVMHSGNFAKNFPFLKKINLDHSGALAFGLLASATFFHTSPSFQHLTEININYPTISRLYYTTNLSASIMTMAQLRLNLTSIKARAVTLKGFSVHMFGTLRNATSTRLFGKLWNSTKRFLLSAHFKENGVIWNFPLPINEDGSVSLRILDLAHNHVVQVSPSLLSRLMKLTEFYFSENTLRKIPKNIFMNNPMLQIVDLSQNLLEIIDLKLNHLKCLQIFNISNNHIHFLDSSAMKTFDQLVIQSRMFLAEENETSNHSQLSKQWYSQSFQLILVGNPIYCSCEYITFLRWIIKQSFIKDTETLKCFLDSKPENISPLDEQAVSSTEYKCQLPKLIATSTVLSTAAFITILLSTYCAITRYKRKQRNKKVQDTIEKYKSDKNLQFPVFLPYCSADARFVEKWVIPGLNTSLKHMLATEENCIATGDRCFKPGKWVKEEVIRCIEISSVVVACISENFCKSNFCTDEVMVALTANKPVILMFLEHVHEKSMPKSICKHFNKTARAKWTLGNDGTYTLTPGFDVLCSTILELMNQSNEIHASTYI